PAGVWKMLTVLMTLGCMLLYVYYSTVYSTIQDVIEPSLRGTAMALYFFAMYLLGGALGPMALGIVSDHYAYEAAVAAGANVQGLSGQALTEALKDYAPQGLHGAFYMVPLICGALAVVLAAGARTVTADAER